MRHGMPLALACLLFAAGILQAQERVPLPPPNPSADGGAAQLPSSPIPMPGLIVPPPPPSLYPPPSGYVAPPPPPPPPYAPPVAFTDPAAPRFWVGAEALLWWVKNQPLGIPVITTGPAAQGTNAGALGMPGTTSLTSPLDFGAESGVRLFGGVWLDPNLTFGLDASLFLLGRQCADYSVGDRSGTGQFVINEPVAGAPFATQVSAPGVETGAVSVDATSRFSGGDVNALYNLHRGGAWTINLLGGFRYLELDETLTLSANSSLFTTTTYQDNLGNVLATAPPGSNVNVVDFFGAHNRFYGGQLGTQFQYQTGRWSVSGAAKLALGATREAINVSGNTYVTPPNGNTATLAGGNFATLQTGHYVADRFAVAPELQLNVGYQLTPCMRGLIGYNFFYLSSVARPGNQIDNTYDGVTHPLVPMANSSFWAQGLNFSLLFSF